MVVMATDLVRHALVTARKAANLTQRDLATVLGVSQTFLSDVESGKRRLPRSYLPKLPKKIRKPVVDALAASLQAEIAEARATLKEP
jgi:transcriptional regulator with XRE-family HTH domain